MDNVVGASSWLISTIFDIFAFLVMLRFIMQFTRASFSNPVGDLLMKVTTPFLKPLRKIIPGIGGHDVAALVLVLLILLAKYIVLASMGPGSWASAIPLALVGVLKVAIEVFMIAIIVRVILSWVSPGGHALSGVLDSVSSPVLKPIQRFVKPFEGLDLSPLVAILLLMFVKILLGG